jgi:hypothetical protein
LPACPTCGRDLTWIPQYERFYCYAEKAYAAKGYSTPPAAGPAIQLGSAGKESHVGHYHCPSCDRELSFIAQYDRYYCYEEKKYAPRDITPVTLGGAAVTAIEPPASAPPAEVIPTPVEAPKAVEPAVTPPAAMSPEPTPPAVQETAPVLTVETPTVEPALPAVVEPAGIPAAETPAAAEGPLSTEEAGPVDTGKDRRRPPLKRARVRAAKKPQLEIWSKAYGLSTRGTRESLRNRLLQYMDDHHMPDREEVTIVEAAIPVATLEPAPADFATAPAEPPEVIIPPVEPVLPPIPEPVVVAQPEPVGAQPEPEPVKKALPEPKPVPALAPERTSVLLPEVRPSPEPEPRPAPELVREAPTVKESVPQPEPTPEPQPTPIPEAQAPAVPEPQTLPAPEPSPVEVPVTSRPAEPPAERLIREPEPLQEPAVREPTPTPKTPVEPWLESPREVTPPSRAPAQRFIEKPAEPVPQPAPPARVVGEPVGAPPRAASSAVRMEAPPARATQAPTRIQEQPVTRLEVAKALPCPNCGRELTYISRYERLYCFSCGRYAPKGYGQDRIAAEAPKPPTASPVVASPQILEPPRPVAAPKAVEVRPENVCPSCGRTMRYIKEWQRWWCDAEKKYAPKRIKNPCPTCGKELSFIRQYERWYCPFEKKYAPKSYQASLPMAGSAAGPAGTTPAVAQAKLAAAAATVTTAPAEAARATHAHKGPTVGIALAATGYTLFIMQVLIFAQPTMNIIPGIGEPDTILLDEILQVTAFVLALAGTALGLSALRGRSK